MRKSVLALACALIGVALIGRADTVAAGIATGAAACIDILLPSLFPFMALSGFVALSGLGDLVSLPLRPITRFLLRLPDELGATVLAAITGGFPTGARTLATLVEQRRLSAEDAARMLVFCINPGPAFVVVAVGDRMFGSRRLGWLLLGAQILSTLLLGGYAMRQGVPVKIRTAPTMGYADALVTAVGNACAGMLSVCSYVLLFSALSALIFPLLGGGFCSALVTGLLEVTAGCAAAGRIGGKVGVLLAAFLLCFSGMSVVCQVTALVVGSGIHPRALLRSRVVGGLLSALWMAAFLRLSGGAFPTFSASLPPIAACESNRLLGAFCLAAMVLTVFWNVTPTRNRAG